LRTGSKRHVIVMALLTAVFSLHVAGQAVQFWAPLSFLPAFESFQRSTLPYSTLLLMQLLILALMLRTCLCVGEIAQLRSPGSMRQGQREGQFKVVALAYRQKFGFDLEPFVEKAEP
jgi:hypothetical protein